VPIYEYECNNCHEHLEILQKINDPNLTQCPECQQHTLKKLISASVFKLKGTGWYETDFKHKKPPATAKQGAESNQSDKSSTTKSDKGNIDSANQSKADNKSTPSTSEKTAN
jgi:putative FmdB family regulatory protein